MNKTFDAMYPGIKHLLKIVQSSKSQKMTEYDLKASTAQGLCCIASNEAGMNATELSDYMKVDKAQVSRCVAELGAKGLVYCDKQDGKLYRQKYRLTPKGEQVAADLAGTSRTIRAQIRAGVSDEEMEEFFRVVGKFCENAGHISDEE